jgi:hypothetical protein
MRRSGARQRAPEFPVRDCQRIRSVGFIRQRLRDFQCCLHFPVCGLNVPQHIQPGLGTYYGHAAGKLVLQAIYPQGRNASFGFLELTFKF